MVVLNLHELWPMSWLQHGLQRLQLFEYPWAQHLAGLSGWCGIWYLHLPFPLVAHILPPQPRTAMITGSEFTELAKSRFLDCDSCGMTQGALIRNVADCQALYMQTKQPRSDILYMTTLDTGRCSHSTCSLVVLIALYLTIPMAASRSTDSS